MDIAIQNKNKDINRLNKAINNTTVQQTPFSIKEKKKWFKHYQDKIIFYKPQENIKWKVWPQKIYRNHNDKNKANKLKKKASKLKKKAESIINSKQVRILVDMDVPAEAVVILGKGLGFVPTPHEDVEDLRLDGRRLCSRLAYVDKNGASSSNYVNHIPSKLNSSGDLSYPYMCHLR